MGINNYTDFDIRNIFTDEVISKIYSYNELPNGWDYGIGIAPSEETISRAIELYQIGSPYGFKGDATPLNNGGITISFSLEDNFIDIIIDPSLDSFSWRYEKGIGQEYDILEDKENSSLEDIIEALKQIQSKTCFSFEPLTYGITNQIGEDFPVSASKTLATGYQSLKRHVRSLQVA